MAIRDSPTQTLLVLRIFWALTIAVQAAALALVTIVFVRVSPQPNSQHRPEMIWIVVAAMLVLTPVGYFVRNQLYKAHWRGLAISPFGYFLGNMALLALMQGVCIFAMKVAFDSVTLDALYVAGAAVLVQLINFPTGRPMEPTPPVFGERDRP